MKALRVESLCKNFGGVQAARNVSFSVEGGQHIAIIGPNGAGKTTLFNLLNGQIAPTSGFIYFFGRKINNMAVYERAQLGIGRSFQITSLFLNLTVLKNMLLALQGTQPSRFQMFRPSTAYQNFYTKAQKLLESMDLWGKKDEPVQDISYGEQRKLEIALSLGSEPKLLLLDEPSCGLTSAESADITGHIRDLGKNIAVILVAHDMDLVFSVAERILVLHYGEIIAQGTPEEIRDDPRVKEIYMGAQREVRHA
jgi:branched-chain amino acid transport system ATP-binding protein